MLLEKLTSIRRDEAGIAMVEIVVSAMLLIVVAIGVFTAFDSGTRATAEERHRARAHDLAEADLARMQSMRIGDLANLDQTRNVTQDGLSYTIRSRAEFVMETASTSTCANGTGSNDFLKISSTVTWPSIGSRPPVTVTSVVSPPNGSVVPNAGSLLVSVEDSQSAAISGVALSGSGPASFSGTTGASGCVLWRNLPAGNYTMSVSGIASGKVDVDGNPPQPQTVSVVAQSTNTVALQYDNPGLIQGISFTTRNYANVVVPSAADSVVVDNTGMTTARVFTAPGGVPVPLMATTSTLFPFSSPYAIYTGTCGANNPGTGPGLGSATVPIGGSVTGPVVQQPALHLTVYDKTNLTNSSPVAGAVVKVRDTGCSNFLRTLATDTQGQLLDPGLPWGTHSVCVSGVASNGQLRRATTGSAGTADPVLNDFNAGTTLDLFLRGGGTQAGACP